ncbi:hypothetical protein I4U23_017014 [Adineta vaga]|nr:hypothetical protein I4U23_017014 [Adineta vaga]
MTEIPDECYTDPSIRCEEHACRPGTLGIACGDGDCRETGCQNGRWKRFQRALYSKPKSIRIKETCWDAMNDLIRDKKYKEMPYAMHYAQRDCPAVIDFPAYPVALGHIHFVYTKKQFLIDSVNEFAIPNYICYKDELCPNISTIHSLFSSVNHTPIHTNRSLKCHATTFLPFHQMSRITHWDDLLLAIEEFFSSSCLSYDQMRYPDKIKCSSHSQLYQCKHSSKCISKYRLHDGLRDCPLGDDEDYPESCSLPHQQYRFKCQQSNQLSVCASSILLDHKQYQCTTRLLNEQLDLSNGKFHENSLISFQTLCDGFQERLPLIINNENETDETNCYDHIWPCKNLYTQCDGYWNCQNGADELGCPSQFDNSINNIICDPMEHICVSIKTLKLMCLNLSKVDDGKIDCLGGYDERKPCRIYNEKNSLNRRFLCRDDTIPNNKSIFDSEWLSCIFIDELCDGSEDCGISSEDEQICSSSSKEVNYCALSNNRYKSRIHEILCSLDETNKPTIVHFAFKRSMNALTNSTVETVSNSIIQSFQNIRSLIDSHLYMYHRRCNRGVPIQMRQGKSNTFKTYCLCPPSYYGLNCELQSQRISITLQFRVSGEWRTVFKFVITLIDSDYRVHSSEQLTYVSFSHCNSKFSFYLLYKTRMKNERRNYFIRIDTFLANTSEHRASWIYPIKFLFLPVHRLAFQLNIPLKSSTELCSLFCNNHGICIKDQNSQQEMCFCHSGWTGLHCEKKYQCECSSDALCVGSSLTCLCPLNRFGRRCYLEQNICESFPPVCFHGGLCVPTDIRMQTFGKSYMCTCLNDYSGDQCQYRNTRINIKFSPKIIDYSSALFLHLISANGKQTHTRTTMLAKVNFDQTDVRFYTSFEFHIIFAQSKTNYYLIDILPEYIPERNISKEILFSQRCLSIFELFNLTIIQYHPLRRAKYYHQACQQYKSLSCFYDLDTFLCLCTNDRHANCFNFDFHIENDCRGNNYCLNKGKCFQDLPQCPTISVCSCADCHYGSRCQFSTKTYGISLDAILGYHIRPNLSFFKQSKPVKTSMALVITISTLGMISSILSILTFRKENARKLGSGVYLFVSSILCSLIMCTLLFKFLLLYLIQSEVLIQPWILKSNCILMDFLLQIFLHMVDWLNACVSIERVIAKWIIPFIIIINIGTEVHDPIHRRLIHDEDEHRTWCIADYEIHPYTLSSIITTVCSRSSLHTNGTYKQVLIKQFQGHKHLLITSALLILLTLPRLIITFATGCMNHQNYIKKNFVLFLGQYRQTIRR